MSRTGVRRAQGLCLKSDPRVHLGGGLLGALNRSTRPLRQDVPPTTHSLSSQCSEGQREGGGPRPRPPLLLLQSPRAISEATRQERGVLSVQAQDPGFLLQDSGFGVKTGA